jgi:HlyD family secretion protein
MFRKIVLPVLAIAGVALAVWTAVQSARPIPAAQPVAEPPRPQFPRKLSGAGIIEAGTRNIAIGTHLPGIVSRVFVTVGGKVAAQDPLFVLDDRKHQADLSVKQSALLEAQARLTRLNEAPRAEELPIARAKVRESEAGLEDLRFQLKVVEGVSDRRAISVEDLNKRRYAVEGAEARLARAKADLSLLEAGSWKADIDVAQAEVARAESEVHAAQVEIDRLTVRSPTQGEVLQVSVRPGEYAQSGALAQPLILLGNLDRLHVRVDIDENDAWRFTPDTPAVAYLRGHPETKADLKFEYVESYVIPKRSLTGDSTERVDTRVLQVIYSFERGKLHVYPGQQVDVYIEDRTPSSPGEREGKKK